MLQRRDAAEEIQPAERRLSTLPGKLHLRPGLGGDVLLDEGFQRGVVHDRLLGFIDIKTVAAIEIAT
ncbi:hypothetical protein D3C76_1436620 [compost metagenome]